MLANWRQIAVALYHNVVAAGQADHVVSRALSQMNIAEISAVLAVGKAACGMAQSAYDNGVRVARDKALIIAPSDDQNNAHNWPLIQSAHPVPDQNSLIAGQQAAALCQSLNDDDHLLVLLSGGASALMVAPHPPLTLDDKIELNDRLLASGGDIHQINAIRRLVSQIKGGRLAAMAAPAQITQFIISDVENDQLSSIGSGIMAPDPMPVSESLALIETLGMADLWWVADLHKQYADGRITPPLSPDHPLCDKIDSHILASNKQVIHAGVIPDILSSLFAGNDQHSKAQAPHIIAYPRLSGEASVMAGCLAEATISAVNQTGKTVIGITGGETVVTLPHDHGLGGRSQELALAFALAFKTAMQGSDMPWLILAAGTDGRDGPTDAAGAILDSQMPLDIASAKLALLRHDVWNYLDQSGGLFRPGASGTNLADLVVIIAG